MIVCDREHLGLVDATARRNAFGRQIASFEAELEVDGPRPRADPRGVHPGAVDRGARPRGRGAGRASTATRSRSAQGEVLLVRLPSRAHRRLARARPADGDGHRARGERAAERARRASRGVRDPRVENLARILVGYSTEVKEGDTCVIEGPTRRRAADRRGLRGGARRRAATRSSRSPSRVRPPTFFKHASDAQLEWVSPLAEWAAEEADCRIAIGADTNTRELSGVTPEQPDEAPGGDPRT